MDGSKGKRASGILLHITSLPSSHGIGDMGKGAYDFIDFLDKAGQSYWQVLPVNPTSMDKGNSPYASSSAFAGNRLLISPDLLCCEGYIEARELQECRKEFMGVDNRVDYSLATSFKARLLDLAFRKFNDQSDFDHKRRMDFQVFCSKNKYWLDHYSMFTAFSNYFGQGTENRSWYSWPEAVRDREGKALEALSGKLEKEIEEQRFYQYLFFDQWRRLKEYAAEKNIGIIGDLPIYVDHESSDVWSHPELFKLDDHYGPAYVSGTPPDYFSRTGQLWNNPVYDWGVLKNTGFEWWIKRIEHNMAIFDLIRIDHFRGFAAYWEVEKGKTTAEEGRWVKSFGEELFGILKKRYGRLPFIAENLGVITGDVEKLRKKLGLPGTRVLQFAFGDDFPENDFLPHNFEKNSVAYTGTHDNNTSRGWWLENAAAIEKKNLRLYAGRRITPWNVSKELIRLLGPSVADTVIVPMQDILGLGSEARMNLPATDKGNWQWRMPSAMMTTKLEKMLMDMTEIYGRKKGAVK
jgi:4-alpha-glucanotransferase